MLHKVFALLRMGIVSSALALIIFIVPNKATPTTERLSALLVGLCFLFIGLALVEIPKRRFKKFVGPRYNYLTWRHGEGIAIDTESRTIWLQKGMSRAKYSFDDIRQWAWVSGSNRTIIGTAEAILNILFIGAYLRFFLNISKHRFNVQTKDVSRSQWDIGVRTWDKMMKWSEVFTQALQENKKFPQTAETI